MLRFSIEMIACYNNQLICLCDGFLLFPLMDQTSTFHGSVRNLWADLGDALSQQCLWHHETPGRLVNSELPDVLLRVSSLRGYGANWE